MTGPRRATRTLPAGQNAPCAWWVRYMPSSEGGSSTWRPAGRDGQRHLAVVLERERPAPMARARASGWPSPGASNGERPAPGVDAVDAPDRRARSPSSPASQDPAALRGGAVERRAGGPVDVDDAAGPESAPGASRARRGGANDRLEVRRRGALIAGPGRDHVAELVQPPRGERVEVHRQALLPHLARAAPGCRPGRTRRGFASAFREASSPRSDRRRGRPPSGPASARRGPGARWRAGRSRRGRRGGPGSVDAA